MDIAEIIDLEAMMHLSLHGCIKNMDPYAQHLLKTSENPVLRYRRWWIRAEAVRQIEEAEQVQPKMNDYLKQAPHRKGANMRQAALVHPYFAEKMRRQHKASWGDRDFMGFVKREDPQLFPEREAR